VVGKLNLAPFMFTPSRAACTTARRPTRKSQRRFGMSNHAEFSVSI